MTGQTDNAQHDLESNPSESLDNRESSDQRATIVDEYEQRVPEKYRALYRLAMSRRSRKAAIRIFCLECVAWIPSEVRRCTSRGCSHFPYWLPG